MPLDGREHGRPVRSPQQARRLADERRSNPFFAPQPRQPLLGLPAWAAAWSSRSTTCASPTRRRNPELLDALAKDFADSKFNLKHLLRTIMNSPGVSAQLDQSRRATSCRHGKRLLRALHREAADGRAARRRGRLRDGHAREVLRACRSARARSSCPTAGCVRTCWTSSAGQRAQVTCECERDGDAEHRPGPAPAERRLRQRQDQQARRPGRQAFPGEEAAAGDCGGTLSGHAVTPARGRGDWRAPSPGSGKPPTPQAGGRGLALGAAELEGVSVQSLRTELTTEAQRTQREKTQRWSGVNWHRHCRSLHEIIQLFSVLRSLRVLCASVVRSFRASRRADVLAGRSPSLSQAL